MATAAVVASASSASAFSPTSLAPLVCYATQQSSYGGESDQAAGQRSSQRRSLHVLNMVSFMEAPTTTFVDIPPRKRQSSPRATARIRRGPAKEARTIELGYKSPDYEMLGLDEYITTSSPQNGVGSASNGIKNNRRDDHNDLSQTHVVPEIDSEILYEGITSAPKSSQRERITKGQITQPKASSKPVASKSKLKKATNNATKVAKKSPPKSKSKSSTMPGFIKDKDLDRHIANLRLSRLPTSQRKLTRMVQSKSAKLKRCQTNSETMYKNSAAVPDSMVDYTQEIHAISRVTPKEEKELGTKTQEAIRLQQLHGDLQEKYGREPSDDEYCAAAGKLNIVALQEAIEDGMEAKNQLVASNLRMVQRVVNLYIRNGLGSEYNAGDLMQDGTMVSIEGRL